jgi:hypothetical protein
MPRRGSRARLGALVETGRRKGGCTTSEVVATSSAVTWRGGLRPLVYSLARPDLEDRKLTVDELSRVVSVCGP